MRVESWDFKDANKMIYESSLERVRKAAEVVKDAAQRECPVGTITRPVYKSGPYAGQPWTASDAGQLKKSIRVSEKYEEKWGVAFKTFGFMGGLVRVYAGHYLAYYANIVEASNPFMRRALASSRSKVKDILENG